MIELELKIVKLGKLVVILALTHPQIFLNVYA